MDQGTCIRVCLMFYKRYMYQSLVLFLAMCMTLFSALCKLAYVYFNSTKHKQILAEIGRSDAIHSCSVYNQVYVKLLNTLH